VLNWDTVQDHMNFVTDKERQAPFAAQFASARKPETNDVAVKHIVLPVDVTFRCLRAPLTEVAFIKVKEGASLDAVQAVVAKYVAYANSESTPPVAAVYGQEVDNPEKELCIVIGWNSTEDKKVAQESAEVKAIAEGVADIGEYKTHTTILRQVVQA